MIVKSKLKFKDNKDNNNTLKLPKHIEKQTSNDLVKEDNKANDSSWYIVEFLEDLQGPISLIDSRTGCRPMFPESGKPLLKYITSKDDNWFVEPQGIDEVLLVHHRESNVISLKTSYGKLISSDSLGMLTFGKEAVGITEEWIPELVTEGHGIRIAFKNKVYGGYLLIDNNKKILRADSDEPDQGFLVLAQRKYKKTTLKRDEKQDQQKLSLDEILMFEKNQENLLQNSRNKHLDLNLNELEQANNEGRLREEFLERRIRKKHDPYC